MIDGAVKHVPPARQAAISHALAEKRAARATIPARSTFEMIEAIQVELNRQLHPLLTSSQERDLAEDELDRMIRISSATIAIHRQLTDPDAAVDPTKVPTAELRKLAGKGAR